MGKSLISNHFPSRLHDLLDDAQKMGHDHLVSWSQDGMSFKIHNPTALVPTLKKYFRQTKYKSLLRQLQGYDYKRVTNGENKGQVSHPMFSRGNRSDCMLMKRKQNKSSSTSSHSKKGTSSSATTSSVGNVASSSSNRITTKNQVSSMTGNILSGNVASSSSNHITTKNTVSSIIGNILNGNVASLPTPPHVSSTQDHTEKSMMGSRPIPFRAISEFQPQQSSPSFGGRIMHNSSGMKQLEINLQMAQNQEQRQMQTATTVGPPSVVGDNPAGHQRRYQQQQQDLNQGLDALRVEIGCTFSTSSTNSKDKNRKNLSLKRSAVSPQQQEHFVVNSSRSAPSLETQMFKRQRSHEKIQRHYSHNTNLEGSYQNTSFPISMIQQQQQMKCHDQQRKLNQFDQLENLIQFCPQEPLSSSSSSQHQNHQQLFQQMSDATNPSFGSLDLDISLTTTTTTTTHHPIGNTSSVERQFYNQIIFPIELEPTPFRTPQNDTKNMNNNIVNHGNIIGIPSFSPKPVENTTKIDSIVLENLPSSDLSSEKRSDMVSEVSDDIDVRIVQIFDDDNNGNEGCGNDGGPKDPTSKFDSVCEEKEQQQQGTKVDSWARVVEQIVFDGTLDCVMDPELFEFEFESQRLLSNKNRNSSNDNALQAPQQLHQDILPEPSCKQQQQLFLQQHQRQMAMMQQQQKQGNIHNLASNLPVPQRRTSIPQGQQMQQSPTMGVPYPILSRPMPFRQRHHIHTQIA